VDWFANCGQQPAAPAGIDFRLASSWEEVERCSRGLAWWNSLQEGVNVFAEYLSAHHRREFQMLWSAVNKAGDRAVEAEVLPRIQPFVSQHGLGTEFAQGVNMIVGGFGLEQEYGARLEHPSELFTRLFGLYEAGHCPCGWEGGEWPEGRLVLF